MKQFGAVLVPAILVILCAADALSAARSEAEAFQDANAAYVELSRDAKKRSSRTNWIKVIRLYSEVQQTYPRSPFAPRAVYMKGKLYEQLFGYSGRAADLEQAVNAYEAVALRYPESSLADDGLYKAGRIYERRLKKPDRANELYRRIITAFASGDMAQRAREGLNALHLDQGPSHVSEGLTLVTGVRQWSNKEYTRVVIDMGREAPFETFILPSDPAAKRPYRVVVDVSNARTPPKLPYKYEVNDGILSYMRISQNQKDKVRVVLDLSSKSYYNAFPLSNPARIVVDVSADRDFADKHHKAPANGITSVKPGSHSRMPQDVPSIARQLALKVSRIVIDPGHGGKDPGAVGPGGILEKHLTLEVAKILAKRLQLEGFEVFLTRDRDVFMTLEERTAVANRKKADLFLSLHVNANENRSVRGIETYFLNLTTDASSIQVAARENATTQKSLSDLQLILNDLMLNSKINESSRFASCVQKNLMGSVTHIGYRGRDLGVKQAPFYVLLGAQMPSILLEMGFITNTNDCTLLRRSTYQQTLVEGIAKGINTYITNTTYAYYGRKQ